MSKNEEPVESVEQLRKDAPVVLSDESIKKRLLDIQEEFFRRDAILGALSESEEFSEFIFNLADTANTAKAIKSVCEVFGITMEDFFAAFGFNATEEDEDDEEEDEGDEGEEEEGDEEEGPAPGPAPVPAPPKKKRPILDEEFIKP